MVPTVADGEGLVAGDAHAARTRSRPSRIAARLGWPMDLAPGLVRVVADVGGLDRRQGAVVKEARFPSQQVHLGAQPGGRVRQLEELLLAAQLDLEDATD